MLRLKPNTSTLYVGKNGTLHCRPVIWDVLFAGYIQFITLATFVFDEVLCIYGLYLSITKGIPYEGINEYLLLGAFAGIMIPVAIFLYAIHVDDLNYNRALQLYHS